MKERRVACTTAFYEEYYRFQGGILDFSRLQSFTEYISGGYDFIRYTDYYRARTLIAVLSVFPLLLCAVVSFSRKVGVGGLNGGPDAGKLTQHVMPLRQEAKRVGGQVSREDQFTA